MAYLATVEGEEYRMEVQPVGGDLYKVIINGDKEVLLDVRRHGCCIYSVLNGGESYEVDVDDGPKGGYSVLVKGEHFHIDIMDEMQKKLLSIVGEGAGAASGEVSTAMPGQVVKVLVKEGQQVKQGEPLVILEAMKMENEFKATVDGIVKTVKVKEGDTVEANFVLVELEPQE
jgi:biotin carboxyl carrier protein